MAEPDEQQEPEVTPQDYPISPPDTTPPALVEPLTCDWAKQGLNNALQGMMGAGSGVSEYHVGSRGLRRLKATDQQKNVDWWCKMVEYYCGAEALPPSITGRDTAFRVVPRDV